MRTWKSPRSGRTQRRAASTTVVPGPCGTGALMGWDLWQTVVLAPVLSVLITDHSSVLPA